MNRILETLAGRRVLLLQGPVGPFFAKLANTLHARGQAVFKINFHAGDVLFHTRRSTLFRAPMDQWPDFLATFIRGNDIDAIVLYGDCRPIHQAAIVVARRLGCFVGVFEEGYIRPSYITFEEGGVNANSTIPCDPEFYRALPAPGELPKLKPLNGFWHLMAYGALYFAAGAVGRRLTPHYQHHRPLSLSEGLPWARSIWRKWCAAPHDRACQKMLTQAGAPNFFLVPLQVFNDYQVRAHSDYETVEDFIVETLRSFARRAPKKSHLLFKHHPMDRGYVDYRALIQAHAEKLDISDRVHYGHDFHLPTLLERAQGVIVINSTVGLSALHHGAPTKVCGTALYDMKGLAFQGTLDAFWREAKGARPDPALLVRYQHYLIERTQSPGNFYRGTAFAAAPAKIQEKTPLRAARVRSSPRAPRDLAGAVPSGERGLGVAPPR